MAFRKFMVKRKKILHIEKQVMRITFVTKRYMVPWKPCSRLLRDVYHAHLGYVHM